MIPLRAVARLYRNRGRVMSLRTWEYAVRFGLLLTLGAVRLDSVLAQQPGGVNLGGQGLPGTTGASSVVETVDLSVYLKDPDGRPIQGAAVVTLTKLSGEVFRQENTKSGHVLFAFVPPTEYNIQVVARAYREP
jgi:hypothetical protein